MRDKLAATVGPVFWSDLRAHVERGAVRIVDGSLDLVDVGVALAADDATRVGEWLGRGLIAPTTDAEVAAWSACAGPRWNALVVAPFVLVQWVPSPDDGAA